jgi:hypothetical protein
MGTGTSLKIAEVVCVCVWGGGLVPCPLQLILLVIRGSTLRWPIVIRAKDRVRGAV